MRNLKFIIGFACTGFFLSLFFGIFSHSNFGRLLLQALLFSIIFAILGVIIKFVFDKFLDDKSSEAIDVGNNEVHAASQHKGSYVDLVIQDEELPASESENQFFVGENHQMLNDSDYHKRGASDRNGFVPMQKESMDNLTGTEAFTREELSSKGASMESIKDDNQGFSSPFEVANSGNNAKEIKVEGKNSIKSGNKKVPYDSSANRTEASGGENLDNLPDMNDLTFGKSDEDSEEQENGFGTPSYSNSNGQSKSIEGIDPANASLMAKAISSILSGES